MSTTDGPSTSEEATFPGTGATTVDHLPHTQKYVLADEWGFQQVGGSFPAGTPSYVIGNELPEEVYERSTVRLLKALVLPVALVLSGFAWLIYWHGLTPLWQQLLCALAIGTGYTGLFAVAHDAARFALLPASLGLNDFIGSLIMAPALFSFESWRQRFVFHVVAVNALGEDTGVWHPLTKDRLEILAEAAARERAAHAVTEPSTSTASASTIDATQAAGDGQGSTEQQQAESSSSSAPSSSRIERFARAVVRAVQRLPEFPLASIVLAIEKLLATTPLKLLASIGGWLRHFDCLDLRSFHYLDRGKQLGSWIWPIAFAGFGFPAIISSVGLQGWVAMWLLPWLVFHLWMSTLLMVRHIAPHIPWRLRGEGWDQGSATVSGCVTVRLPGVIEAAINHLNYPLPHHIAPAIPFYNTVRAHEWLSERLSPYMTQTRLSAKLITNHITRWQVYDHAREEYRTVEEVIAEIEEGMKQQQQQLGPATA